MTHQEHEERFNGLPTAVKLDILGIPEAARKSILEEKQRLTVERINEHFDTEGNVGSYQVARLLDKLKSKKLIVTCYTNCSQDTAKIMLVRSGLDKYLDLLVTNANVKKPKPDPEGYNKIMQVYDISPEETVIIEDSDKGYAAAVASGARVIRVRNSLDVNLNLLEQIL